MNKLIACAIACAIVSLSLNGCLSRRTRLTQERSALLEEREQLQQPFALAPSNGRVVDEPAEKPASSAERLKHIDERVAEIDVELMR